MSSNNFRMAGRTGLAVAVAILLVWAVSGEIRAAGRPQVIRATVDFTVGSGQLTIVGANFSSTPNVKLGRTPLAVISASPTQIVASLQAVAGIRNLPGDYLLRICEGEEPGEHREGGRREREDDNASCATFVVTIGAVGPSGPMGPPGAKGDKGDQGLQGFQGPQGPAGPTGATGATGPAGAPGRDGRDGQNCTGGGPPPAPGPIGELKIEDIHPPHQASSILSVTGGLTITPGTGGGGGGAGKPMFQNVMVVKFVDEFSPKQLMFGAEGKLIKSLDINVFRQPSQDVELTYHLEEAFITSIKQAGNNTELPTESISFEFGKIKIRWTPATGPPIDFCWDVRHEMGC